MNKKKYRNYSRDIMYDIPLPSPDTDEGKFVATINYQIPKRILLNGRSKTSPKFETMYGVIYCNILFQMGLIFMHQEHLEKVEVFFNIQNQKIG